MCADTRSVVECLQNKQTKMSSFSIPEINFSIDPENLSQELREYIAYDPESEVDERRWNLTVDSLESSPVGAPEPPTPALPTGDNLSPVLHMDEDLDVFKFDSVDINDLLSMTSEGRPTQQQEQIITVLNDPDGVMENTLPTTTDIPLTVTMGDHIALVKQPDMLLPTNTESELANNCVSSTVGVLDEGQLTDLPVKELNRKLQGLPKDEIQKIKRKRRTLKNRGYAANSRDKRQKFKSLLEVENQHLTNQLEIATSEISYYKSEAEKAKQRAKQMEKEKEYYQEQCLVLQQQVVPASPLNSVLSGEHSLLA